MNGRRSSAASSAAPLALLGDIRVLIEEARKRAASTVNSELTMLYWRIGQRIHTQVLDGRRGAYGKEVLPTLAAQLVKEYGSSFAEQNLRRMVQVAATFPDEQILVSLIRELSWTHFIALMPLKDPLQRDYYAQMASAERWSVRTLRERIDSMLNNESGLLGLSDLSNDMRTLEQEREQGHPGAALAIEVFCYRLAKSLAAMSCALPQLDGVIFTGGIGENSPLVRAKTAAHLRLFDLRLDQEANARCVRGVAGPIQAAGHPRVLVIPTNEERQIALDTLALLD